MKDFRWYMNRLRAMNFWEICWRLAQKRIQRQEKKLFGKRHAKITEEIFYAGKEALIFHENRLPISDYTIKKAYDKSTQIYLPGGYDYEKYRMAWHAGFQTSEKWPSIFSYDLSYKQKDEIGDARTNWELNRHFQFALLACNYYQSGEEKYLTELSELFKDWNKENPFLIGISWTSVMEIAIRDINWMFTLGFLEKRMDGNPEWEFKQLCNELRIGVINMSSYISAHYSRFSSANNHVIVEACALGIAGITMECKEWYEIAFDILQQEIQRQNYPDGVNKEASLHYQSFFMEAVGLLMLIMQKNNILVPQMWRNTLSCMSRYLSDCQGNYGETVVFGDDDEGKILDLEGVSDGSVLQSHGKGRKRNHYQYVLQLMSLVLPERYAETVTDKTLFMLVSQEEIQKVKDKPYYRNTKSICYEQGGVSLLKSKDGRVLIGIDHGELGFGSIAAHGHADALSFQMYMDGQCVFSDPGTYIYHIDLESRNAFRRTENHNTLTVDGKNQSEMLGAFLWGKRANVKLVSHNLPIVDDTLRNASVFCLEAEHDGYAPVIHRRKFEFDKKGCFKIQDILLGVREEILYKINFILGERCEIKKVDKYVYQFIMDNVIKAEMKIQGHESSVDIKETKISLAYGQSCRTDKMEISGQTNQNITIQTEISW